MFSVFSDYVAEIQEADEIVGEVTFRRACCFAATASGAASPFDQGCNGTWSVRETGRSSSCARSIPSAEALEAAGLSD